MPVPTRSPHCPVALILGYAAGTQITLTLTNVISFRNLTDGASAFWYVRLTGTFGWIVAGVVVGWVLNPISPQPLYLAAATSAVLAAFALALPHTPPKGYGRPVSEVIGLPAVKMLSDRSFVVFAGVLVLCNMMNQFYTLFTSPYLHDLGVQLDLGAYGRLAPEVIMTLAQWCEISCMAATPWLLRRFGLKQLMFLGLGGLCCGTRCFYTANVPGIVAVGLPMHGWGYAFYGMLGAYFVDREAPQHLRAGAQSLVTFFGSGPAVLVGNLLAGNTVGVHRTDGVTNWSAVWLVPLIGYVVALVAFVVLFREPPERNEEKAGMAAKKHNKKHKRKPTEINRIHSLVLRLLLCFLCFFAAILFASFGARHVEVLQIQIDRRYRSRKRTPRHGLAVLRRPCAAVSADRGRAAHGR